MRALAPCLAGVTLGVCATAYAQSAIAEQAASDVFRNGGFGAVAIVSLVANWVQWRNKQQLEQAQSKANADGQALALQQVQAITKIDATLQSFNGTLLTLASEFRALADRVRRDSR